MDAVDLSRKRPHCDCDDDLASLDLEAMLP